MAGNDAIQFLRGSDLVTNFDNITLNAGQPCYDLENNLLYIGNGKDYLVNLTPFVAGEKHLYWHNITLITRYSYAYISIYNTDSTQITENNHSFYFTSGRYYQVTGYYKTTDGTYYPLVYMSYAAGVFILYHCTGAAIVMETTEISTLGDSVTQIF